MFQLNEQNKLDAKICSKLFEHEKGLIQSEISVKDLMDVVIHLQDNFWEKMGQIQKQLDD